MQLEPLRQQSEKAKKYLELKDELMGVEVAVWLDTLDKLSAAAKKAEEDYASAAFVLQQSHDDLDSLYARSEEMGELLRQRDGELESARLKVTMLESAHQQLDGQMAVLRGNIRNNEENLARIQEEMKGQESRSGGIAAQLEQAEARILQIDRDLRDKREKLTGLQQELAALTAGAQGITRQFLELRTKETTLAADQAGREADLRGLEVSIEENAQRASQVQQDLDAGTAREQAARQQLQECQKELRKAREDVTAANNTIAGYTLRQNTRIKRRDELAQQLRQLVAQLDGVKAKTKVFRAMERDFEHYQKSVKTVMQEAQRGGLRNIHGPVSKLIRTEDSYTVAIEIALGMAMQQIVVDSEADGKAAISWLKRTGGGRATFLPMSAIQGKVLRESGLDSCRGYVGIASELVSCQPLYRGIVDNLLGRTVITEDIDAAIAMAKRYSNRFKIVTGHEPRWLYDRWLCQ